MSNTVLLKNSVLYTAGNLLLKAFSFFLLPLYTTFLSTDEYGIINLSSSFYTLSSSILILCLQYAVIRFYTDLKDDIKKVAKMYGTVICFIVITSVIFILICLLFHSFLCKSLFDGIPFFPIVFLSIFIAVFMGLYTVYQDILKGMQMAKKSILFSYLFFFLMLAINIVTVVVFNLGATGVILSTLGVYIIMVVIMFIDLYRHNLIVICIDTKMLGNLLKYSLPILPHNLSFNIQSFTTRVIINKYLSLSGLGLYSLAYQFGSIADVILSSVQSAFQPWFYTEMKNKCDYNTIAKLTYSLIWFYGFFFLVLGLYSQEAVMLMSTPTYHEAWIYIPFIIFSTSLKIPLYFLINFMYFDKAKTKYIFISTIVGCLISIMFTFIFVPYYGIFGAILADIVALIFRFLIVVYFVRDIVYKVYSIKRMYLLSLLSMIFLGFGIYPSFVFYPYNFELSNLLIKSVILLLYIIFAIYSNRYIVFDVLSKYIKR